MRDIDFLRRMITVERQVQRGKVCPPKTRASHRTVPVGAFVIEALAEHLARSPASGEDFVFQGHGGRCCVAAQLPNLSRDGTPYLAANCGGACVGDKSIYQDVSIPGGTAGTVEYGGMFMSENGNGQLAVGVHQLDAAYGLLRSDFIPVTTGGAWAPAGNRAPLLAATRILRFQYYLQTSVTFRADDLYLRRIA